MIKNIIFDFGGVLLDIDFELTYTELSKVTGLDISVDNIPPQVIKIMLGFEKGEINKETFLWNLQQVSSNLTPDPNVLIKAWNKMLIGWNPQRFELLKALRSDYKVYLLSNTNAIHLEWVKRDLKKNHQIDGFEELFFDGVFYSHIIKKRKPTKGIYKYVNNQLGIIPEETLFIDDMSVNVEAARKLGWKAIVHDPKTEISEMLPRYIKAIEG